MPRVSILMPSYNHARFVREAIDSVKAQTFTDWELLIADDGSKDDSMKVLEANRSDRIHVEANPNNIGTYATLDRLLAKASGDLVAILNSDDRWAPGKLERQVEMMDDYLEATACYTLGARVDAGGKPLGGDDHGDWPTEPLQELFPYLLEENRVLASSVVFRSHVVRFNTALRYSGDWIALLRAARQGPVCCLADFLTQWRMHERNSFVRSSAQVAEEISVRKSILSRYKSTRFHRFDKEVMATHLSRCAMHLSALLVLQGRQTEAKEAAQSAIRLNRTSEAIRRRVIVSLPSFLSRPRLWGSEEAHQPSKDIKVEI